MGNIIHRFYNGNRSWKSDPENRTLKHPIGLTSDGTFDW